MAGVQEVAPSKTREDPSAAGNSAWLLSSWGAYVPNVGRSTMPAPQQPSGESPSRTSTEEPPSSSGYDNSEGGVPHLSLVPSETHLTTGEILRVTVSLSEAHGVSSVPFHLSFNPAVLEFLSARVGPAFMGTSLQPILLAGVSPSRPGDLAVGLALVGASGLLDRGGGLVVLEFQARQAGQADLSFDRTSVRGPFSQELPVEVQGAAVEVR